MSEADTELFGARLPATSPTLYFDLGSPYAYLACERASGVLGGAPELEPVLLGAIFTRRGFGSWSRTSARPARVADIEARARRYGLAPLRWPAVWPADGLLAMRCATWAKQQGGCEGFARAVFRGQFAEGGDIADRSLLLRCAADAGLDGEAMLQAVVEPHVKNALRLATDAAWEVGVRGVPALRVGKTIVPGDDQLELAAALIG